MSRAHSLDPRPISTSEERLLAFEQMHPGTSVNNIPIVLRFRVVVSASAIQDAIACLVRRHESLRASYHAGSKYVADVASCAELKPRTLFPPDGFDPEVDAHVDALFGAAANEPFDLALPPLIRAWFAELGDATLLLLVFHHIAADATAINVMLRELGVLLAGGSLGDVPVIPQLNGEAAEHARIEKDLRFWEQELRIPPSAFAPSAASTRTEAQRYAAASLGVTLSPEAVRGLRAFARSSKSTPFNVLLASYGVVLARFADRSDVVVWVPVSTRTRANAEVAGCFVNVLPITIDVALQELFDDLVRSVGTRTAKAFRHRHAPLEALRTWAGPTRGNAAADGFAASLNYRSYYPYSLPLQPQDVRRLSTATTLYDVALTVENVGDDLRLCLEYDVDVVEPELAGSILEATVAFVSDVARTGGGRVGSLSMMSPETAARVRTLSHGAPTEPGLRPLHDGLQRAAEMFSARVAVRDDSGDHGYSEILDRARAVGSELHRLGVTRGDLVALAADQPSDAVVGILGIWLAGAAFVPVDSNLPDARAQRIVSSSGVRVILASDAARAGSRFPDSKVVLLSRSREGGTTSAPARSDTEDSLAYVMFTSGSTGEPKGVAVSHRALARSTRSRLSYYGERSYDRSLLLYSYAVDASLAVILPTLLCGGTLVGVGNVRAMDSHAIAALVEREGITLWDSTPSLYEMILADHPDKLASLRRVIVGGEALPRRLADRHAATLPARLFNEYGPTEATIWATVAEVSFEQGIGRPVAGVHVYVVDEVGKLVPPGIVGELCIGGETLADGYWRRSDLTADAFMSSSFDDGLRVYRTGDFARRTAAGDLIFEGRKDRQIKLRGHRVELDEIDAIVGDDDAVVSVRTILKSSRDSERIVSYVVARNPGPALTERLRESLARRLPYYMVPASIVFLSQLPLTASGKFDEAAAEARGLDEPDEPIDDRPARRSYETETERIVHDLWSELLRLPHVSVDDDVFDLGADSLLAMRANARIKQTLGAAVALNDIFLHRTIRTYAAMLDERSPRITSDPADAHGETADRLTRAQEAIWLSGKVSPDLPLFNLSVALRTSRPVNLEALRSATMDLIERHPALALRFGELDGSVTAQEAAPDPRAFRVIDLSDGGSETAELRRLEKTPVDLHAGPPFDVHLMIVPGGSSIAFVRAHHIVCDGPSLAIVVRDLATLYRERCNGEIPSREPAGVRYADHADRSRAAEDSGKFADSIAYWRAELAELESELMLPCDRRRSGVPSFAGDSVGFTIDASTRRRLDQVAKLSRATLFTTIAAAFAAVLGRYGAHDVVTIGIAVDTRDGPQLDGVVGNFTNLVPLRISVADDATFVEHVRAVHAKATSAYEHAFVSFERLVEELRLRRTAAMHPVFQATISMNRALPEGTVFGDDSPEVRDSGTVKFDLGLTLDDAGDVVRARLQYAEDLFDPTTVERLASSIATFLRAASLSPNEKVSLLPCLGDAELRTVLELSTGKDVRSAEAGLGVHEVFLRRVEETPGSIALVSGDEAMTYAELARRSSIVALGLRRDGVAVGDRVGVHLDRGPNYVVAILGVLRAGAIYVPIDSESPEERVVSMIRAAGVKLCLTEARFKERVRRGGAVARTLHVPDVDAASLTALPAQPHAYVMFTSGSTGEPKAVLVNHRGIVNLCRVADFAPILKTDRVAQIASIGFDASTYEIWAALLNGAALHMIPRDVAADASALTSYVKERSVSVVHVMSALFNAIVSDDPRAFDGTRIVLFGGEAGDLTITRSALGSGAPRIVHAYGPTETTVFVTTLECTESSLSSIQRLTIGKPIANTRVYVVDFAGRPAPLGALGEIVIGGASVAEGYLNDDEASTSRFGNDPLGAGASVYRTGDMARLLPSGDLEFHGRRDRQVKLHGYRIEPDEIEAVLIEHPSVRDAVVVVSGEPEMLVAYVVSEGTADLERDLRGALRRRLPHYMLPSAIVVLSELPQTTNGKIDRAALPEPAAVRQRDEERTPTEESVARLWSLFVGTEQFGIDASFFEVGGHSLVAPKVVNAIKNAHGVEVPLRVFFRYPTVRDVAAYVDGALRDESAAGFVTTKNE